MNATQTIIAMLSAHLITDYTLQGWVVDEEGEVYYCEECMKAKKKDETDEQ